MRTDSWTAERVDLLRRLWAQGETASAIAARLGGVSRSAVLGKIFRLRLDAAATPNKQRGRSTKTTKQSASEPKAPRASAAAPSSRTVAEFFARRRRARNAATQPKPASSHKSLLELVNDSCRWPHGRPGGKFFFCGAPGADLERGIPYCERHMRRAYTVPEVIVEAATKLRQARPPSAPVKSTPR